MAARTITAAAISSIFKQEILENAAKLSTTLRRRPKLVGILANADDPSRKYAESTGRACSEVGLDFELVTLGSQSDAVQPADVEQSILEANLNKAVDGIMVYYPIFSSQEDSYLQQVVSPAKDVEGLHFFWRFNLYHNMRWIKPATLLSGQMSALTLDNSKNAQGSASRTEQSGLVKAILPCTPLALVKALEYLQVYNPLMEYGQRAFGKTITCINRSEVVGRPLAALLANDGARVFSVDLNNTVEYNRRKQVVDGKKVPAWQLEHTTSECNLSLQECLKISDVVISGVPSSKYQINTQDLKDGVVAINFSSAKNFEPDVKDKASLYVPTIGKLTIAMLQRNLLRLADYTNQV